MTENREFKTASIEEVNTALTGKTIKRIEGSPAIGQNGFTIICSGEEDADGIAVSVCRSSADGATFHISE